MDANNLATVLGPNILRTNPTPSVATGPKSYFVEKLERAEERSDVILVVRYAVDDIQRAAFSVNRFQSERFEACKHFLPRFLPFKKN